MTDQHEVIVTPARTLIDADSNGAMEILRGAISSIHDIPVDNLTQLIALYKDLEDRNAKKAYDIALVALKKALPTAIEHDQKVHYDSNKGAVSYGYASLAAASELITPVLNDHGFSVGYFPSFSNGYVEVRCKLSHEGGHFEEASIGAPPDSKGGKTVTQGVGSTITSLERYLLLSMLGLATKEQKEHIEEPRNGQKSDQVTTATCMAYLKRFVELGKSRAEVEEYIGKEVQQWEGGDLKALEDWGRSLKEEKPSEEALADLFNKGADSVDYD